MSAIKITDTCCSKILEILEKPEFDREAQEIHFISMALKKKVLEDRDITDWWFLHRCIQSLVVSSQTHIRPSKIQWVFVISGNFSYHGMIFQKGQHLTVGKQKADYLILNKESTYLILTRHALAEAKNSSEDRKIFQQKEFVKKVLFGKSAMTNRQFHELWQTMEHVKIKKGLQMNLSTYQDTMFIVVSGSLSLQYPWRRTLKLRELAVGSLLSTYMGRYFNTTAEKIKNEQKLQFRYIATEDSLLLGIPIDIFYEQLKFQPFKFIIEKCWNMYLERVSEANRIIKELGIMKPEKKQIQKSLKDQLQEKQLHQRAISIPVAIEQRKFRKIIYNFFDERSNRRKVPNLAIKSHKQLGSQTARVRTEPAITEPIRSQIRTEISTSRRKHQHFRSHTEAVSEDKNRRKISFSLKQLKTRETTIEQNVEQPQQNKYMVINNFFRPEQFVSHKLKIHYQTILSKLDRLKIPTGVTEHSEQRIKFKSDKEYFEKYVNERRIVKLGPKKRLLYKAKQGF